MSRGGKEFGKEIFFPAAFRLPSFARTKYPAPFCGKGFGRISLEKMLLLATIHAVEIFLLLLIQHISGESTVFSFCLLLLAALGVANLHKFIYSLNERGSWTGIHFLRHLQGASQMPPLNFLQGRYAINNCWAAATGVILPMQSRGENELFHGQIATFRKAACKLTLWQQENLCPLLTVSAQHKKSFLGIFIIFRSLTWSGTYFLRKFGTIYPLETTEVSGN